MYVNGEAHSLAGAASLKDFLISQGFNPDRVAVELNGAIVPRAAFADTEVTDRDRLEVLHFVGGG